MRIAVATGAVALLSLGGLAACSGKSGGQTLASTKGNSADTGSSGALSTGKKKPKIDTSMLSDDSGMLSDDTGSIDTSGGLDTDSGGSVTEFKGQYFSFEVPSGYSETKEDGYITAWQSSTRGAEILVSSPAVLKGVTDPAKGAAALKASFAAKGYSTVEQDISQNLTYDTDQDQDFILSNPSDGSALAASVVVHDGTPVLLLALFDSYSNHTDVTADVAHIAQTWTWAD